MISNIERTEAVLERDGRIQPDVLSPTYSSDAYLGSLDHVVLIIV